MPFASRRREKMHGLTNPMLKLQDPSGLGAAKGMLFGMRLVSFGFFLP
jgi:hypothetical protein